MSTRNRTIVSLSFDGSGVVFTYADDDSIRKDGALQMGHNLFVGADVDYRDGIDEILEKAQEVLADALEDYAVSDVVVEREEDDDDDDKGMGMG